MNDSFEVRKSVPFDVERVTATRIFPPNSYPVDLNIIANQDFEGTIREVVPGNFVVNDSAVSDYPHKEMNTSSTALEGESNLGATSSAVLGLPLAIKTVA